MTMQVRLCKCGHRKLAHLRNTGNLLQTECAEVECECKEYEDTDTYAEVEVERKTQWVAVAIPPEDRAQPEQFVMVDFFKTEEPQGTHFVVAVGEDGDSASLSPLEPEIEPLEPPDSDPFGLIADTRIVCGAMCTWWNNIQAAAVTVSGLPCCPKCGKPLFEFDNIASWWEARSRDHHANWNDHEKFVEWLRDKCFVSIHHAKMAYHEELGPQ